MCSALATLLRTMLSLSVALTLLFGLVGAPAASVVAVASISAQCPADAPDDAAACLADAADPGDEERAQEPILAAAAALPRFAAPVRPIAPSAATGDPHRFASEHDRPPRLAPASTRSETVRRA
jgi:hypothetical protein